MKPLYYILLAVLAVGLIRCVEDPEIDTTIQHMRVPELSETKQVDINASSIELSATIVKQNGSSVKECGFCWSESSSIDPQINITEKRYVTAKQIQDQQFSATINDLSDKTKYYVYAFAVNDAGIAFSEKAGVYTTISGIGEVSTASIETDSIRASSAWVSGIIKSRGDGIDELGFYWSKENREPSSSDSVTYYKGKDIEKIDSFACQLKNLEQETLYYVRAFAKNRFGEFAFSVDSFKTVNGKSVLSAISVCDTSFTSAEVSATISSMGEGEITSYGFCWGTEKELSIDKNDTIVCSNMDKKKLTFNARLEDLKSDQLYYICAYVINAFGVSYSPVQSFMTKSELLDLTTVAVEMSSIKNGCALLRGHLKNTENFKIEEFGFCWSSSTKNPTLENCQNNFVKLPKDSLKEDGSFCYLLKNLSGSLDYTYNVFAKKTNGILQYSDFVQRFSTPLIFKEIRIETDQIGKIYSSVFVLDNKIFLLGGDEGSSCSKDLYFYDYKSNRWNGGSPYFEEAGHMASCTIGDNAYVVGGLTKNSQLALLNVYNHMDNTWRRLTPMPKTCFDAVAFAYKDSVYVLGGEYAGEKSRNLYRYDSRRNSWKLITDSFPAAQKKGITFVLGNTVYAGLGEGSENKLWMASDSLTSWKEVPNIPVDLRQVKAVTHYNEKGWNSLFMLDADGYLWEYDLLVKKWKKRLQTLSRRTKSSFMCVVNGNIYILGQEDFNNSYFKIYNLIWDPVNEYIE